MIISAPALGEGALRFSIMLAAHVISIGGAGLWLACLLSGSTAGQTPSSHKVFGRYQQFVWREQQGLPQNTVQAITRTRDGYLWLGTLAGAARFDGARFTVFDNGNIDAIKGSYITALLEDRQGNLWMTSDNGGLDLFRDGGFAHYTMADGLAGNPIRNLFQDRAATCGSARKTAGLATSKMGRLLTSPPKTGSMTTSLSRSSLIRTIRAPTYG